MYCTCNKEGQQCNIQEFPFKTPTNRELTQCTLLCPLFTSSPPYAIIHHVTLTLTMYHNMHSNSHPSVYIPSTQPPSHPIYLEVGVGNSSNCLFLLPLSHSDEGRIVQIFNYPDQQISCGKTEAEKGYLNQATTRLPGIQSVSQLMEGIHTSMSHTPILGAFVVGCTATQQTYNGKYEQSLLHNYIPHPTCQTAR